jgi:tRNA (guanine37-N1)-methyltransferase
MNGILTASELPLISKSLDIIGDIAILKIESALLEKRFELAEALIQKTRSIKVVVRQIAPTGTALRIKSIEWLSGEKRTVTIHREHGCNFKVDIAKVFFSPRLSYERMRIAKLVASSARRETIVNFYSGVGCFSILIAKYAPVNKVYSIDINPYAALYQMTNVVLNHMQGKITVMLGRAEDLVPGLVGKANRVIMPLPELALQHLPYALSALGPKGGIIHFYSFEKAISKDEAIRISIETISNRLTSLGTTFDVTASRIVRTVGPRVYHVALDLRIDSNAR